MAKLKMVPPVLELTWKEFAMLGRIISVAYEEAAKDGPSFTQEGYDLLGEIWSVFPFNDEGLDWLSGQGDSDD